MGRKRFAEYATEWSPPDYTVDAAGKVVGGYTPPEPHNWNRWGPDDERGAANLTTAECVRDAATLVRDGAVFSLGLPLDRTAPIAAGRPLVHYYSMSGTDHVCGTPYNTPRPDDDLRTSRVGKPFTDDGVHMALQTATHWDALCHVLHEDVFYNGHWAGGFTASDGPQRLGIEAHRNSFVGRGVLLDVARHAGVDHLAPGAPITSAEMDAVCEAQGVTVRAGDIVLFRTGYLSTWYALTTDSERAAWIAGPTPGVGLDGAEWIAAHDVAAVASDTLPFEVEPREDPERDPLRVHVRLIVDLGVAIGELWNLDDLAAACAADRRWEFLLVAPPLNIPGGVGSPLNPIAIR